MPPDLQGRVTEILSRAPAPRLVHTRGGPVEVAVAGTGPVLLVMHGILAGCDQGFLHAGCATGDGFTVVSPSRPGYLGTPLSAGMTLEQQADLFADVLDGLGVADTTVLAVSAGAAHALHFALRHRGRCRALVLVSGCTQKLDARTPLWLRLLGLTARLPTLAAALGRGAVRDLDRAARPSIVNPAVRARLLADPEAAAQFAANLQGGMNRLGERLPGSRNDRDGLGAMPDFPFERIAVPVLAVHGTQDPFVPIVHARSVAERVPDAALFEIEDGDHSCLFTHGTEIRARVRAFLAGLDQAGVVTAASAVAAPR